jgi:hypothetical protein
MRSPNLCALGKTVAGVIGDAVRGLVVGVTAGSVYGVLCGVAYGVIHGNIGTGLAFGLRSAMAGALAGALVGAVGRTVGGDDSAFQDEDFVQGPGIDSEPIKKGVMAALRSIWNPRGVRGRVWSGRATKIHSADNG